GRSPFSDVESLAFTPDGKRLAAAAFRQGTAHLWDITNKEQFALLNHGEIYGLSFSADGKTLATAGWDSKVRLWDSSTGKLNGEVDASRYAVRGTATKSFAAGRTNSDFRMYAICYAAFGNLA